MAAELDVALGTLLAEELPGLFGGADPVVALRVISDALVLDARSAEATAGQPRPDDRLDAFPVDQAHPAGPYTLTAPPYPGPRRVRLRAPNGAVATLTPAELVWDGPKLTLVLTRDVTGFTVLEVLYGVTAVFTSIKGVRTLQLALDGDELHSAEALALAVIALNRDRLIGDAALDYQDGDYRARGHVLALRITEARGLAAESRGLTLVAEVGYKLERALREDEGTPIEYILTPGRTPDPARRVDIGIDVDA
jgi:hypothetical protein